MLQLRQPVCYSKLPYVNAQYDTLNHSSFCIACHILQWYTDMAWSSAVHAPPRARYSGRVDYDILIHLDSYRPYRILGLGTYKVYQHLTDWLFELEDKY